MPLSETFDNLYNIDGSPPSPSPPIENSSERWLNRTMPVQSKPALSGTDRVVLRLDKLLEPTKDIGSVLSSFNYTLYFLAYLDAKLAPMRRKILGVFSHDVILAASAESSGFARLGGVVYNTRATLRLFGLLPIYIRMRKLLRDSKKGTDPLLHLLAVVQCTFDGTFQLLENLAFLAENRVLPKGLVERWTRNGGRATGLYRLAHRAWFLSVVCDLFRLFRVGELVVSGMRGHGEKEREDGKKEAHWYPEWIRPLAWLPIAWHLSAWSEESVGKNLNMGVRGVAGVLADLGRTLTLWHATNSVLAEPHGS